LGKWIYSEGKDYQNLPSYQDLEANHGKLHAYIGRILELKDQGEIVAANAEMLNLEAASTKVIELLDQLESDIVNGG
jgi:methyl-accepting chemotaxis protein